MEASPDADAESMENSDFLADSTISEKSFDPVAKARKRNKQLPSSRYISYLSIQNEYEMLMQ
jgi:hypothetical protein